MDLHDPDGLTQQVYESLPRPQHLAALLDQAVALNRLPVSDQDSFQDLTWEVGPHHYGLPFLKVKLTYDNQWGTFRAIAPFTPDTLERAFHDDTMAMDGVVMEYLDEQLDDGDRRDVWERLSQDANTSYHRQHDAQAILAQCGAQSFLLEAEQEGNPDLLRTALRLGAGLNRPDEAGNTCLHRVVLLGRSALIEPVVKAGAWVEAVNHKGQSPLHVAASLHDKRACIALMAMGADKDRVDLAGKTPAELALEKTKQHLRGFQL